MLLVSTAPKEPKPDLSKLTKNQKKNQKKKQKKKQKRQQELWELQQKQLTEQSTSEVEPTTPTNELDGRLDEQDEAGALKEVLHCPCQYLLMYSFKTVNLTSKTILNCIVLLNCSFMRVVNKCYRSYLNSVVAS